MADAPDHATTMPQHLLDMRRRIYTCIQERRPDCQDLLRRYTHLLHMHHVKRHASLRRRN